MSKNKGLVLSILGILSIVLITTGVTYAFFTYTGEGTTDNIITTDSITFLYTEVDKVGNGIQIQNAFPKSDELGKVSTKTNEYFDFKITSGTTSTTSIPYEVTARKSSDSDDIDEYVRLYLTKDNEEVLLKNYSNLTQTSKVDSSKYTERTIYTGKVPANNPNFEESFRLRMWLREGTRFENEQMNNKTFTITVNVYANAKVVTEEEIALENSAKINLLLINNTELTKVENKNYDYEISLPEDTSSANINIETENPKSTVMVHKVNSLASTNNVKRLSVTKKLELTNGFNYFKVTVTSENKKVTTEYKLKVLVGDLNLDMAIFDKYKVMEKEATLTSTSVGANENGLYKSVLTNSGEATYYFRGNVENYIDFAGFTWRVVRINEDGTIRIVMQDGTNTAGYSINSTFSVKDNMYYSNSDIAKPELEDWYNDKIASNTKYSNRVAKGEYYCEAAKVAYNDTYASYSGADMITFLNYKNPNFECKPDKNGHGLVDASVGLLSYDEVFHAGSAPYNENRNYYLYNNSFYWTMSPSGFSGYVAYLWSSPNSGGIDIDSVNKGPRLLRPVINLKADTIVTGTGDSGNHWVVAN